MASVRKIANALALKRRVYSARHQAPTTPTVSSADPAEAYMAACLAASFFCYVSPSIYGLAESSDGRAEKRKASRKGDEG
jgi:hypothetical protein